MSLTHFVVHTPLHLSHSGPALLLLHLGVIVEDLIPQPGQVVDTHLVFLAFIDTVINYKFYYSSFFNGFTLLQVVNTALKLLIPIFKHIFQLSELPPVSPFPLSLSNCHVH